MTFACNIPILAFSSLDEETYDTFLQLLKGEFNVPTVARGTRIKSALVQFWRNRERLSLRAEKVCFDGRPILKKSDVARVVKKAFKETKGSGTRKLFHRLKNVYRGVGERDIRRVLKISPTSTIKCTFSKQGHPEADKGTQCANPSPS